MKLYGVVGWKNAGKTGLVERLVAAFVAEGWRVSTLKHTHHAVDLDRPGTDSDRHRAAGAQEVLLASSRRWALLHDCPDARDDAVDVPSLVARLAPVDLVLIEGFKTAGHPKIEVVRAGAGHPLIAATDRTVRAVATDDVAIAIDRPVFHLDDTAAIAAFIRAEIGA